MKAVADALAGRGHDVPRIVRSGGPLEQACGFQQRPPPAAAEQDWLDCGGHTAQCSHERRDVEQTGMIRDQHTSALWQLT
jgi:hypothetical protein